MPADPLDIARFTTDGTLLVSPIDIEESEEIAALHIDARDQLSEEIEMFYVDPDDAQEILDQIFALSSSAAPTYLAAEVKDTLNLGTTIPISPVVPSMTVRDTPDEAGEDLRVRGYAAQLGSDRYVVELLGE